MPSILRPNHRFLASPANSGKFLNIFPLPTISGVPQHRVFLTFFHVPLQQLGMLFVSEQTFQPWYYGSIPHHLGRNLLSGWLTINITMVISSISYTVVHCISGIYSHSRTSHHGRGCSH